MTEPQSTESPAPAGATAAPGTATAPVAHDALTEQAFWENYWSTLKLPATIDPRLSFDRCLSRGLKRHLQGKRGQVLEIGCAPGKWLAYLAAETGLVGSGIEYSDRGATATRENLARLGLPAGEILHGDFFKLEPEPRFDVVMSLGFIEHFDDPVAVVRRHAAWLKPGGTLVLGVPNFRGVHGVLQRMMDRKVLELHNLKVMSREFFAGLADSCGLDTESIEYLGSFEPCLPMQTKKSNHASAVLAKVVIRTALPVRRSPVFDSWNAPWLSSYLLAVYKKRGPAA
jgi:SAM-dependent methyltransferase